MGSDKEMLENSATEQFQWLDLQEAEFVLSESPDDEVVAKLCRKIAEILQSDLLTFFRAATEQKQMQAVHVIGSEPLRMISQQSSLLSVSDDGWIDYQKTASVFPNLSGRPDGVRAMLSLQLQFGEKKLGMINLGSFQANGFSRDNRPIYELLAQKCSNILHSRQLMQAHKKALGRVEELLERLQQQPAGAAHSAVNSLSSEDEQRKSIRQELNVLLTNARLLPAILEVRSYKRARHSAGLIAAAAEKLISLL